MKKKTLLMLLFVWMLPVFAIAHDAVSSDTTTVKIDESQKIAVLENSVADLQKNVRLIEYTKSLKAEDIENLLDKYRKAEKNSPIRIITLIILLYVGVFIFLTVSVGNIQNMAPALGLLLEKTLKKRFIWAFSGVIIFFIFIFISDNVYLFIALTILNFMLATYIIMTSIHSLNLHTLMQQMFENNQDAVKDTIEFYINKREFTAAYNLLNSLKLYTEKYGSNKIKDKHKSIKDLQALFGNENLVYNKIIFRDFFKIYIDILFNTKDGGLISSIVKIFLRNIDKIYERNDEYYVKLYENGTENIVFLIEKTIKFKNINNTNKEQFMQFLIIMFVKFLRRSMDDNRKGDVNYILEDILKVIYMAEFTEQMVKMFKHEFTDLLIVRDIKKINHMLMFFEHRLIKNCIKKEMSASLIDEFIKLHYNFVFLQCNDAKHWNKHLTEYKKMSNKEEVIKFLAQYSLQ